MSKSRVTLTTISSQIQSLSIRFDSFDDRLTSVETRLTSVENRVGSVESRLFSIEGVLGEHSAAIDWLKQRLDALHGLTERIEVRLARLEQEYVMITAALRRLEARFDILERQKLAERIAALESRVTTLEAESESSR